MQYRTWAPGEPLATAVRSVALGVFDGLHLGHRAVIAGARNVQPRSAAQPMPLVTVLSLVGVPKPGGRLLTSELEKEQALTLGVDEWLSVPFETLRNLSPEEFVHRIVHTELHAETVCCGSNFRFGRQGAGTAADLCRLCEPLGIQVNIVPTVENAGEPISSTAVRRALEGGKPERAMALLGRPYTVAFPVKAGNHVGSGWGYPTVNQPFPNDYVCPRRGVYASLVNIDGVQHCAVTNIGVHPTVGGTGQPQAETYISGYTGDLYGAAVQVQLIRFLRPECQFPGVELLRQQIAEDARTAVRLLNGSEETQAVLFDFDDTLQHRPQAFLGVARELLERHFPQLSPKECANRAAWMLQKNNNGYVDYTAYFEEVCAQWAWGVSPEELKREFRQRFPFHSVLFKETVPVLKELKRRGYKLGVITNGNAMQQHLKLDAVKIRPLLDAVAVSGTEGTHKPEAELFLRVARRLCVAPKNCVYVGDYPPNDQVGAESAGMRFVYADMFGRCQCPKGAWHIAALPDLLERLEKN